MDPKLESFAALCKTMHYGRAAEALNVSQPTVSKHIRALEEEYGAPLFQYAGRRLRLTAQGKLLLQYTQSLRYNEAALLHAMRDKPRDVLRIGATKSIGDYILLPEIRRFLTAGENELEFLVDNTANLLAHLEDGALDFVILEGIFDKSRYDSFLFRREPYVGVCAADAPICGRKLTPEELFGERLILRERGSGTRNILERELAEQGYRTDAFRVQVCISSFKLIRDLVREGFGISFVYEAVVKDDDAIGRFFCPPLTGSHELNAVFLKNTQAGRLAQQFLQP